MIHTGTTVAMTAKAARNTAAAHSHQSGVARSSAYTARRPPSASGAAMATALSRSPSHEAKG
jgi:hypothetical protein